MADSSKVPYLTGYGNITRALQRIQSAATPDKFTQDFLSTKLDMSGGGARPVIPFLKRAGFLASDGAPTELYRRFKNKSAAGAAAAEGLRNAYAAVYEINEYAHALKDDKLKGVILQITGLEQESKLLPAMVGSFKALLAFASFDPSSGTLEEVRDEAKTKTLDNANDGQSRLSEGQLRLGYTINLNLPATTDIAVFNAIFKSLREHLLP